ncbi:hypothetical protein B0T20DRAFT_68064 [Sordaria brevicollis]|uniref:Uncharacterized protein n=1 Tax=Sordaria brevicollis TaxID=83679 RepID=A0AAE0P1T8_SORBR|nr:hypothetical protein B0T20DRAFT_68064 [Sordaria brevicollis]
MILRDPIDEAVCLLLLLFSLVLCQLVFALVMRKIVVSLNADLSTFDGSLGAKQARQLNYAKLSHSDQGPRFPGEPGLLPDCQNRQNNGCIPYGPQPESPCGC